MKASRVRVPLSQRIPKKGENQFFRENNGILGSRYMEEGLLAS